MDTSAFVKYYYPEEGSERVENLVLGATKIHLGWITPTEFASALVRKVRMGDLSAEHRSLIWESFLSDLQSASIDIAAPTDDFLEAAELVMEHGVTKNLRTLDALQLSSALRVSKARFVTADRDLAGVAKAAGLQTVVI